MSISKRQGRSGEGAEERAELGLRRLRSEWSRAQDGGLSVTPVAANTETKPDWLKASGEALVWYP